MPDLSFSGPQSSAVASICDGPAQFLCLAFFPDALKLLTGVDVQDYVDRTVPLEQVASGKFLDLFLSLQAKGCAPEKYDEFETGLEVCGQKFGRRDRPCRTDCATGRWRLVFGQQTPTRQKVRARFSAESDPWQDFLVAVLSATREMKTFTNSLSVRSGQVTVLSRNSLWTLAFQIKRTCHGSSSRCMARARQNYGS